MTNEYMTPEVIEIGNANEVILGSKIFLGLDDDTEAVEPDGDLDE